MVLYVAFLIHYENHTYKRNEYFGCAAPIGSDFNTAMISDKTGRHLVIMPHLERSTFPWNWAYYPKDRKNDEVSPWVEAFVNAREWLEKAK
ncbi:MAG: phosphoribosylformylglycinamidine synthase subunit PurQ [Aequorivita sp.]